MKFGKVPKSRVRSPWVRLPGLNLYVYRWSYSHLAGYTARICKPTRLGNAIAGIPHTAKHNWLLMVEEECSLGRELIYMTRTTSLAEAQTLFRTWLAAQAAAFRGALEEFAEFEEANNAS